MYIKKWNAIRYNNFVCKYPQQIMPFDTHPAHPHTVIVEIGQALDFRNVSAFKQVYLQQIRLGMRFFILDFSETGILDSTGLGAIFYLHRQIKDFGGRVVFANPSRPVQVVVQLTRTFNTFQQFVSTEEALNKLAEEATPPSLEVLLPPLRPN
jgi:anti-sigma B factor antagonist